MTDNVKLVKVKCPRCGTLVNWQGNPDKPFCSQKCRTVDLGRWASEEFRIAGDKVHQEEE